MLRINSFKRTILTNYVSFCDQSVDYLAPTLYYRKITLIKTTKLETYNN